MDLSSKIFNQLTIMMIIAFIGFCFSKISKVNDVEEKFLSRLLLFFINPCVIITSFNVDFDTSKLLGLIIAIVLAFVITSGFAIIAQILFHKNTDLNKLQKIGTVFTNCGFIGIPLIRAIFPDNGVFYLMGYLVVFNTMLWTYGYYQIEGKTNFKKVITNPNIIAITAGIVLFCIPVKIPRLIAYPVELIAGLNTAVSMLLVGILFGGIKKEWMEKLFKTIAAPFKKDSENIGGWKKIGAVLFTSTLRLVLLSFISCGLTLLFYKGMIMVAPGIDGVILREVCIIMYIASLCPTGVSVSSMACLYDKDAVFANFLVCFTHLLCIFTIPVFVNLIENVL